MINTLRLNLPKDLPVIIYPDKTNMDLVERVNSFVQDAINQAAPMAKHFKGGNEAKKVFDFLLKEIQYSADGDLQKILKPNALIKYGVADCKSFALFAAGILANLGYEITLRYAGYEPGSNLLNHVYVISDGVIVDPVYRVFNSEKPFSINQDFKLTKI